MKKLRKLLIWCCDVICGPTGPREQPEIQSKRRSRADDKATLDKLKEARIYQPAEASTDPGKTIEELLADTWHGRDWHKLSSIEYNIFEKLKAVGVMYHYDGFIYAIHRLRRKENPKEPDEASTPSYAGKHGDVYISEFPIPTSELSDLEYRSKADATIRGTRHWDMWARYTGDGQYCHFGAPKFVQLHGGDDPIVQVRLFEDPNGSYYGWMAADETVPTMIYPSEVQLKMCFTNGMAAAINSARGVPIRLRCEPRPVVDSTAP